jgi:GH15 family glucan-1,4-alpha-glucosidase
VLPPRFTAPTNAQAASEGKDLVNGYRSISDYGLIGDCRTAALVSKDGSIDWCCLPNFDSPSVFARLLDSNSGGHFVLHPVGNFKCRQSYIAGTNVLATEFESSLGKARLLDFMPIPSANYEKRHLLPMRQIVRLIEGLSGDVEIEVEYQPRPSYAAKAHPILAKSPYDYVTEERGWHLHLHSEVPLQQNGSGIIGKFRLFEGRQVALGLAYEVQAPAVFPASGKDTRNLLQGTITFWRDWLSHCRYQGQYADAVKRSALALKLLEFAPSGAIVAAPTTSLPEKLEGVRNWDYRYCWLRDASFTLAALQSLGYTEEARAFLDWLLHSTRLTHPRLQVVYNVFGEAVLPQHELDHLEGYRNSRPVRVGNQAWEQKQLDVYGEVLDGVIRTDPEQCKLDKDTRSLISGIADYVSDHWQETDNGIWEMPQEAQFTHSKALCWLALERAMQLLKSCGVSEKKFAKWRQTRDTISKVVLQQGYNPDIQALTQKLGGQELDAALLTLPILDLFKATEPKMASTIRAIQKQLTVNNLVYRYLADDGLPPGEGVFLACTFWLAHCLALQGDVGAACRIFEAGLECCNHLGLLPEEADPRTFEALGNFPQGLTHIALINAAIAIQQAKG